MFVGSGSRRLVVAREDSTGEASPDSTQRIPENIPPLRASDGLSSPRDPIGEVSVTVISQIFAVSQGCSFRREKRALSVGVDTTEAVSARATSPSTDTQRRELSPMD
jgi:hypothetical protein